MAREVLDDVIQIGFPGALVNAFLVKADVLTLIDTGTPGHDRIIDAARSSVLDHKKIARILVTHRHADHAGNAAKLVELSGAEVHASPAEAPYLREGREQPRPRPATRLGRLMVPYVKVALPWRVEPVEVNETLTDGATIGPFRVISTPGHTDGHVSLLWEERGILFTADAAAHITSVGPHPAADDPPTARSSFTRLAEFEFDAACFGHGRPITTNARQHFRH